jgi:hypothetical protein
MPAKPEIGQLGDGVLIHPIIALPGTALTGLFLVTSWTTGAGRLRPARINQWSRKPWTYRCSPPLAQSHHRLTWAPRGIASRRDTQHSIRSRAGWQYS